MKNLKPQFETKLGEKDAVNTFIENLNCEKLFPSGDGNFWTQAAKALMRAVIGYLYEAYPEEQYNLSNALDIVNMGVHSDADDTTTETDFDILFNKLGETNPKSYAYQWYCVFKQAPVKTRLNILISTSVNLSQMI